MANVDLRSIRYDELVHVSNKLRDIGARREEGYRDLIGLSPEFAPVNVELNPNGSQRSQYLGTSGARLYCGED